MPIVLFRQSQCAALLFHPPSIPPYPLSVYGHRIIQRYFRQQIPAGAQSVPSRFDTVTHHNETNRFGLARDVRAHAVVGWFFILILAIFHVGCSEENLQREDIDAFLSEYDPVMKTRRDEIVAGLSANNEQISKLNSLVKSYQSDRARNFVSDQIAKIEIQRDKLRALLADIDSQVELAMASKEINAAGAAGLQAADSRALLKQADQLLRQSNDLSADVSSLFSDPRSHDAPAKPSTDPGKRTKGIPALPVNALTAVINDQDGWSNLRASPGMNGRIIRRIPVGETFMVTGSQGNWRRVTTNSGERGWMHNSVVQIIIN
jgi:hypothetical protein